MDELLPLTQNSAESRAVFGSDAITRVATTGITTTVVEYINADWVLREAIYDYYQKTLNPEQIPGFSTQFQAAEFRILEGTAGGDYVAPRATGSDTLTGTIRLVANAFNNAADLALLLSHEIDRRRGQVLPFEWRVALQRIGHDRSLILSPRRRSCYSARHETLCRTESRTHSQRHRVLLRPALRWPLAGAEQL